MENGFRKEVHALFNSTRVNYSNLDRGEVLYKVGSNAKKLHLVQGGTIVERSEDGLDNHILRINKQGDIFGWDSLIPHRSNELYAQAIEDSQVSSINGSEVLKIITSNPNLILPLLSLILNLRSDSDDHALSMVNDNNDTKTIKALFEFAIKNQLTISHPDIASRSGSNRITTTRSIKKLKDGGFISSYPGKSNFDKKTGYWTRTPSTITITDQAQLEEQLDALTEERKINGRH